MNLSDLYTNLSYGLLSNLSIGGEGSGAVPAEFENRLLHSVSQALTALHTRFTLAVKEVTVRTFDGQTIYPLEKKYAVTDPESVPKKHIADSAANPFLGDVIKILSVGDEMGDEYPLNDTTNDWALFTPTPTTLQIPRAITGDAYFVLYQADHPKLNFGDLLQEVNIPGILKEPLELYVAHKVLSAMNGSEHATKSGEHFQRYMMICDDIEKRDLLSTSQVEATWKFSERGFV